ncbi:MAG: thioesterase domain-containing protein [Bacteroidales bacterium]|nr:thioesterase domain-containing protein [Bacteroidales bacterium]MDD3990462.1 thioesterase domain-containing protein [Bacteroidales bacterium]MDD4639449.1 thioesterase domain-containing protein [Bacteroidales bacterium]
MDSAKVRLFCIPFSGGNAYSYYGFKKYLPVHIEFCNLELPGRGKRIFEPLLLTIKEMTEDLYGQIKQKIKGRYFIYGHSLGALLAYTLCRHIEGMGENLPEVLFVSGQRAPSLIKTDDTHLLPDEAFLNVLREMNGTPEELLSDESFVKYFLPVIRADFRTLSDYRHNPSGKLLNVPVEVFTGTDENIPDEEILGWQKETTAPVNFHKFKGGHFFIFDHIPELCGRFESYVTFLK